MQSFDDIKKEILKFRDDRNWKQFHNPKDIAIALNLEASELLEVFQWSGANLNCTDKNDKIAEELADILIYAVLMADATGLDIKQIMQDKLKANNEKYPIDKAKNSAKKYDEL